MNILLVDDEPLELEQLKWLLHHRYPQWKYYTAIDAIQALKISNETDIQLSFIDIHLPGHSGFELMKEFRSQNKEIGMIIVSAYQKFDYAKESLRLGVFDYIVKPIIEEELYQTVDQYLHNHPEKKNYSPIIEKAIWIIHHSYKEKLTLESLANQIHVNPTYLSRKFTEELEMNYIDYLNHYRIEKAKQILIQYPDKPIAWIADEVGFSSQHHFNHMFRKWTNRTPSQYRKSYK